MIQLSKKNKNVVAKCIASWQQENIVDSATAKRMLETLVEENDTYKSLSVFAFIVAISSVVLALFTVLEAKWLEQIIQYFEWGTIIVAILFLCIGIALVILRVKKGETYTAISKEMLHLAIIIAIAIGLTYMYKYIYGDYSKYYFIFFVLSLLLMFISRWIKSTIIWTGAMLALCIGGAIWLVSGYETHQFVFNLPFQLLIWTSLVVVINLLSRKWITSVMFKTNHVMLIIGLLLLAWLCSIVGNMKSYDAWNEIRQGKLWIWALAYTVSLLFLLLLAFKRKKSYLRDIALAFLVLNVYTRYFEYFWDKTNKALFFIILAVSFWWVGKKIEQIRHRNQVIIVEEEE